MFIPPNTASLKSEYAKKIGTYQYLISKIKTLLNEDLLTKEIKIISLTAREKKFDSFYKKIFRYEIEGDYFVKIDDLAGVRIVCVYLEEMEKIRNIIQKNFQIIREKHLNFDNRVDKTGYQSDHYIVKLKKESVTNADKFLHSDIGNCLCEIQVRTALMHSWSSVSHDLFYKKKLVESDFEREMYALSSLFFFADHQFDRYMKIKKAQTKKEKQIPNLEQPLNADSLSAYINYKFDERPEADDSSLIEMIEQLSALGYATLKDIDLIVEKSKSVLEIYEKDNPIRTQTAIKLDGVGALRICVALADYQNKDSSSFYVKDIQKYREFIND
ncbi:GTP pyrophosphokinase [Candidatus Nitrosopumilus sediminis]|uniref:RelA/SpoT domain-containing protein n=1 Tax=Candidatus Nitrosopumilus sediminis TaxID=1229909 RepID=K0BC11_9ARCH|nr:RelA/SpoT domain-containing protein [Candidatus Nitrosopumilus sediminis]AFS82999.1 RelA/SpoT domain-containing protein [Candidatus Nitrosopumilus sediminis]